MAVKLPHILHQQSMIEQKEKGETKDWQRKRYRELMIEHGHIIKKAK